MDNRLSQMNPRRPRGVVGTPYQVLPPIGYPSVVPPVSYQPPPPPPQNVNIIVNDENNSDREQGVVDYKQDVSISSISAKMLELESLLNSSSAIITLGTTSGQAYPGDEGYTNRSLIMSMTNAINSLQDTLIEYAKTSAVQEIVTNTISTTSISELSGYENIVTKDVVLSSVNSAISSSESLSTVISSVVTQMDPDLTELDQKIKILGYTI